MKLKEICRHGLLAFVLISIGFALGKETALRRTEDAFPDPAAGEEKVTVYYLRSSFRCITCNQVEQMTEELIRTEFADELNAGKMDWQVVDYLRNAGLAARYRVRGNMLLAVRFENGEETGTVRMDRVMELVPDRTAFLEYVRSGIRKALAPSRTAASESSITKPEPVGL